MDAWKVVSRIQEKGKKQWDHKDTIKLPKAVQFEDYASLALENNRLAVVSQATSALWIGTFPEEGWDLLDDGIIYQFPKNDAGETVYCNIEGVSWVTPTQIVVVSDKCKPGGQPKECQQKDQSIHIFNISGMPLRKRRKGERTSKKTAHLSHHQKVCAASW